MEQQEQLPLGPKSYGYNIPKKTRKAILKYLKDNRPMLYADRNDSFTQEQLAKIMASPEGLYDVENEMSEYWIDSAFDLEMEVVEQLKEKFPVLEGISDNEVREEFLEYLSCDIDIKGFIHNTADVVIRLTVHSNYEGVGAGDVKDSEYIHDIKKLMRGKYEPKSFQSELDNLCSSCNQLVFLLKIPVENLIEISKKNWDTITIPKNAWCGFFDKWNGSGSMLDIQLTEDIKLKRQWGKTEFDSLSLNIDKAEKYSVDDVYGLCGYPEGSLKVNESKKLLEGAK